MLTRTKNATILAIELIRSGQQLGGRRKPRVVSTPRQPCRLRCGRIRSSTFDAVTRDRSHCRGAGGRTTESIQHAPNEHERCAARAVDAPRAGDSNAASGRDWRQIANARREARRGASLETTRGRRPAFRCAASSPASTPLPRGASSAPCRRREAGGSVARRATTRREIARHMSERPRDALARLEALRARHLAVPRRVHRAETLARMPSATGRDQCRLSRAAQTVGSAGCGERRSASTIGSADCAPSAPAPRGPDFRAQRRCPAGRCTHRRCRGVPCDTVEPYQTAVLRRHAGRVDVGSVGACGSPRHGSLEVSVHPVG